MKCEIGEQPSDGHIIFRVAHPALITSSLLVSLIGTVSLAVFGFRIIFDGDNIAGAIFLELCCLLVVWMLSAALLRMSPIVVSSSGITKRLFEIPVCTIRWADVAAVQKNRQRQLYGGFGGSRGYSDSYTIRHRAWSLIDAFLPNLTHSVEFSDQFANLRALLNIVNEQSKRYGFPLLLTDFELHAKAASADWFQMTVDDF
jgi:hypothetical protein